MPNPWRLIRLGWIRPVDLETLTLDDVDLLNLYADSVDEAMSKSGDHGGAE